MAKNQTLFGMDQSKAMVWLASGLVIVTGILFAAALSKYRQSSHADYGYGYVNPTPPGPAMPEVTLSGRVAGTAVTKGTVYYTGNLTIKAGQSVELKWNSSSISSCSAPWLSVPKGTNTAAGTSVQGPVWSKTAFTITCTNSSSMAKSTLTVLVN